MGRSFYISGLAKLWMNNHNQLATPIMSDIYKARKNILGSVSMIFSILGLIAQQVLGQVSLEIVNITKDTVIFSDNFESGTIGEAPEADDPKVGIWNWNNTQVTEIKGLKNAKKMVAGRPGTIKTLFPFSF